MAISSEHVTGFVVGLGAATLSLYLYKQNQHRVDDWLRQQGINVPQASAKTIRKCRWKNSPARRSGWRI